MQVGIAFPVAKWGAIQASFIAAGQPLPREATVRVALVFTMQDGRFVLADIKGRGWCIPGGHIEEGETVEQAVRREAMEEVGAVLGKLTVLGHFVLTFEATGETQLVPAFTAPVAELLPLPAGSESSGVRLALRTELPKVYYTWDALLNAVFGFAESVNIGASAL